MIDAMCMRRKRQPGSDRDSDPSHPFVDPQGFLAAVERLEGIYLEQVAAERAAVEAASER